MSEQLLRELYNALNAADLYLNSYDTSAPSRIKAETRATVEAAIGLARASVLDSLGAHDVQLDWNSGNA